MGAYAPAPIVDAAVRARVATTIVTPSIDGLRAEGTPFIGVLFVGLMIEPDGTPWVIEYNCRFGDPEVQALAFGAQAPLLPVLHDAATGQLRPGALACSPSATVVLAAAGYPGVPRAGDVITGLADADAHADVKVFHAGTRRRDDGAFVTHGGRVLPTPTADDEHAHVGVPLGPSGGSVARA